MVKRRDPFDYLRKLSNERKTKNDAALARAARNQRDPAKYMVELSKARKNLQESRDRRTLREATGLSSKPNVAMMNYNFQDKPRKDSSKIFRKILKQAHPNTKFSVTTKNGGTIRINWTDGPSEKTIKKLGFSKVNSRYSDGMGGTTSGRYLFHVRSLSPELKNRETARILKQWDTKGMMEYRKEEIVYREMYKTDYTKAGTPGVAKIGAPIMPKAKKPPTI